MLAKAKKEVLQENKGEIKEKAKEVTLWDVANKLCGSVESAEYKHVVLVLISLKFANDKFENQRAKLFADGREKYIEKPEMYNMNNVFFLEEISGWSYLIKKSKQNDIALRTSVEARGKRDLQKLFKDLGYEL